MRIAIIGAGSVGGAVARGLKGKGHRVVLGVRDRAKPEALALAAETGAELAAPSEAARGADVVVLALPWRDAEAAIRALGPLAGQVVIDCMNPFGMVDGRFALVLGHSTSGGEIVQGWLPQARVVKTLNQIGAGLMARNDHLPLRPVQFVAGNDPEARARAMDLVADLGFAPREAGDITGARLLEPLAMLWIDQAMARGAGRDWAFAAIAPA